MPCPTCNDAGIIEGEACLIRWGRTAGNPPGPYRAARLGPVTAVMPCATCYPLDVTLANTKLVRR